MNDSKPISDADLQTLLKLAIAHHDQGRLSDAEAAGLGLAFYAFILGYALAETEGLLRPISEEDEAELKGLDPFACPATLALIPAFKGLDRDATFEASVETFIDGVACLVERAKARKVNGAPKRACS